MNKILLIALLVFNLLGIGAGCFFTYSALNEPLVKKPVKTDMTTQEFLVHHQIFNDKPIIYTMDPFTVNLANMEEDKKVLLEVNIELNDEKSFKEVADSSALVRDAVVSILARHEHADIATIQGKLSLKDEIALAVNKQLKHTMIRGVYFTKFFVE